MRYKLKIKLGFISNSSTTSFCIYGGMVEKKVFDKTTRKLLGMKKEEYEDLLEEISYWEMWEDAVLGAKLPSNELDVIEAGEYIYVGVSLFDMELDETRREFQARAQAALDKFFGVGVVPGELICEEVYDS